MYLDVCMHTVHLSVQFALCSVLVPLSMTEGINFVSFFIVSATPIRLAKLVSCLFVKFEMDIWFATLDL